MDALIFIAVQAACGLVGGLMGIGIAYGFIKLQQWWQSRG